MTRYEALQVIKETGIIVILRNPPGDVVKIARALYEGGIRAMEITVDTPGSLDTVAAIAKDVPEMLIGSGTVLDAETARLALLAGAKFLVTPALSKEPIVLATRYDTLIIPGVLTPTEMFQASEWGALAVKLFPASTVGPEYIRHVRGPLSHVPIVPTGGIDIHNAAAYIEAGATALGLGSTIVNREDAERGDYQAITERARQCIDIVQEARS